ncbi:ROK family protein [Isobaculum melis]|uniref:Sugar kinase of the NBD/HSP70 family, may contain an N-terminal HTH domain n=1 Tax=Isobaculum melis TaxID=142588 RepID=A0A1H9RJQ1_9LACT|nr:ROK family protein [Isobaculum melis]SER72934.1 Sugar kinase of the NBD/HSP70 family, may contain an N-terminal HTH domain [Isobaculum melis]
MYLVFDIGGTFIKYSLMNQHGKIIKKDKVASPKSCYDTFLQLFFSIIQIHRKDIIGIAMSCPGIIQPNNGEIKFGGSLRYLDGKNLIAEIWQAFQLPATIENDGKCAALAELWLGSIKGKQQAAVLVLGSGLGGGIIVNGQLLHGQHLLAGELSFVASEMDCTTGKGIYAGSVCSSVRMIQKVLVAKGEVAAGGERAFDHIQANDAEVMPIFDAYCLAIANQVMNLQYIFDPELIAIGGGISSQPMVITGIKKGIEKIKKMNPFHLASPQVVNCTFYNDANLYGAMYHYLVKNDLL